jgi:hypothetical protein
VERLQWAAASETLAFGTEHDRAEQLMQEQGQRLINLFRHRSRTKKHFSAMM